MIKNKYNCEKANILLIFMFRYLRRNKNLSYLLKKILPTKKYLLGSQYLLVTTCSLVEFVT